MTHKRQTLLALLAIFIVPLSGLSIDIYVPSLPAVSQYFNVDKSAAQLTISTYLLGLGLMQLLAGSISDSFGRKKPFLIGIIIYIFTALLIPMSSSITELQWLRFLQGIAVACFIVPMRAILSDLFSGKKLHTMINYMTISWALGPIIAPSIGGYLQFYLGWHAPFYFLAIYATIMLVFNLALMPETIIHSHPFNLKKIRKNFIEILTHQKFIMNLFYLGFLFTMLVLFGVIGSFLIQHGLHYSSIDFGNMGLLMGLAWFLGNITNRFSLEIDFRKKSILSFVVMIATSLVMLNYALFHPITIQTIIIPTAVMLYFAGLIFPNYLAQGISLFPQMGATANSLMGASMTFFSAVGTAIGSLLKSDSPVPLALAYLTITAACVILFGVCSRKET